MKRHNEAKWRRLVREGRLREVTAWKKRGLAGPYRLESGEMGGTLDVLKQYVAPDGEKPTHFIHFGRIEEKDVAPVKKPAASWSAQEKPDPTKGPAKFVPRTARLSKHGPQFKFGVNLTSQYNTPLGIYAYPLTEEIFRQVQDGTLPFAQDEPFILLFKVTDRAPILYTSEELPEDEYNEYLERLFSDEVIESERRARDVRAQRGAGRVPSLDWMLQTAEDVEGHETPSAAPSVQAKERDADGFYSSIRYAAVGQRHGHLWALVRAAAGDDPARWTMLFRKLGIGGIVDDVGHRFIHENEPYQAVFFTKRDPEENLELVEVLPNTETVKNIERRRNMEKTREFRKLALKIFKWVNPIPGYRVDKAVLDNLVSHIALRDPWDMLDPGSKSSGTDLEEALITLKEEGPAVVTQFLVQTYSRGSLLEISNDWREWSRKMWDSGLSSQEIDDLPATAAHHKTLQEMREWHNWEPTDAQAKRLSDNPRLGKQMVSHIKTIVDNEVAKHRDMLRHTLEQAPSAASRPPRRPAPFGLGHVADGSEE